MKIFTRLKPADFIVFCIFSFTLVGGVSAKEITSSEIDDITLIEYSDPLAKGGEVSSLLEFNDIKSYRATIVQLEKNVEAYDDAFIAKWPNLSADELSEKEEEIGFDTYQPLKDFEEGYGFNNSMLKDYKKSESNWLNKSNLIESDDPDKFFYELDEEEMVVLNNVGAVKIGGAIYKVFDGGYLKIPSGSTDVLNRYAYYKPNSDNREIGNDVVIVTDNDEDSATEKHNSLSSSPYCFSSGTTRTNWHTAHKRKMKGVVKVVNRPGWNNVLIKSKTKYFKKRWWGWKRQRSNLTAALSGVADDGSTNNCGDFSIIYDENINKKSVTHKSKVKYVIAVNPDIQYFLIQKNKVKGVHKQRSKRREHYLND